MPDQKLSEKEISKLYSDAYPPASATISNETPSADNIHIIQFACKFIYDDGTNDNEGGNVDVPPGGQYTLTAHYSGCCRGYVVVAQVRFNDGSTQTVGNTATTPAGYCGGNVLWHIRLQTMRKQGTPTSAQNVELWCDPPMA